MSEEIKEPQNTLQDENLKETPSSHEYDGIVELDNPSPKWIIAILFATILFAVIYAVHYYGYPGNEKDQVSEYERKVAAFELEKEVMLASSASASADMDMSTILAEGKKLYAEKGCLACHGMNGEGNAIGPNLTDNYWLNGCSEEEVLKIITEGKPEKGMTPFKNMMSGNQIEHLTAYILNEMVGSAPANAKEAQGEECP